MSQPLVATLQHNYFLLKPRHKLCQKRIKNTNFMKVFQGPEKPIAKTQNQPIIVTA